MRKLLASVATAALVGLGVFAISAGPASARVVCNAEGDCWHTDSSYRYTSDFRRRRCTPTVGISTMTGITTTTTTGADTMKAVATGTTVSGSRSNLQFRNNFKQWGGPRAALFVATARSLDFFLVSPEVD